MHSEHTAGRATTTVEAAAKVLGIGRNQAYAAAARGEIPVIRIGKRLLVPIAALERLVNGDARKRPPAFEGTRP
jgi:excisionase family DNA binding protein